MAFEVPSHLKASSSSANHSASQFAVDKVQVSQTGSEHITSLLKPLLGEDWTKLTSREVVGHRQRLELDAQNTKVRPVLRTVSSQLSCSSPTDQTCTRSQNEVLKLISSNYESVTSQLNGSLNSQRRTAQLQSKLAALEREVDGKDQVRLEDSLWLSQSRLWSLTWLSNRPRRHNHSYRRSSKPSQSTPPSRTGSFSLKTNFPSINSSRPTAKRFLHSLLLHLLRRSRPSRSGRSARPCLLDRIGIGVRPPRQAFDRSNSTSFSDYVW